MNPLTTVARASGLSGPEVRNREVRERVMQSSMRARRGSGYAKQSPVGQPMSDPSARQCDWFGDDTPPHRWCGGRLGTFVQFRVPGDHFYADLSRRFTSISVMRETDLDP